MATLAKQEIPAQHKLMLVNMAEIHGDSISAVVRGILRREYERQTATIAVTRSDPGVY